MVITVIDEYNNSFQVTGGTAEKAYENLMYWMKRRGMNITFTEEAVKIEEEE